jgi:hypothetical protein
MMKTTTQHKDGDLSVWWIPQVPMKAFRVPVANVGSWNGKWSGRENFYAVVRSGFTGKLGRAKAAAILAKGSFYYNFGDGWGASIRAQEITGAEARRVRKQSSGFCGYEWMVESICADGTIYSDLRPKPADAPPWPPEYVAPPKSQPTAPTCISAGIF